MKIKATLDNDMKKRLKRVVASFNADKIDWLAWRQKLAARMVECEVDGKVTVLESGRDCDGVVYSGSRHVITASVMAYERLENDIGNWADGPFSLYLATPEEAEEASYQSRDTFAEAAGY